MVYRNGVGLVDQVVLFLSPPWFWMKNHLNFLWFQPWCWCSSVLRFVCGKSW